MGRVPEITSLNHRFRGILLWLAATTGSCISPAAMATCSAGKGFACWWPISTCAPAWTTGSRDKYVDCVAALSNGWCTECLTPPAPDPNCPVGSHLQGDVCVPFITAGLQVSGPPGYSGRSVAPNGDGRLELLGIDGEGRVAHLWQERPSGTFVAANATFAGAIAAAAFPIVVQRFDGRLEALVVSRTGAVMRVKQLAPNVNWGPWTSIGPRRFEPIGIAAAVSPSGALGVAAIAPDKTLWYSQEHDDEWSAWEQVGTSRFAHAPVLANNADGRLELFAVGVDGKLRHAWQSGEDSGFSPWSTLAHGLFKGSPAAMRNLDQRLEVFATTRDGKLVHVWQVAPNGGWSPEAEAQGVHRFDPAVHMNADGTLSVFVVGVDDRAVWMRRQTAPNGGWGDWQSLGGIVKSAPAVGRNADGALQVFAVGEDGNVWSSLQQSPNASTWLPWTRLGIRADRM